MDLGTGNNDGTTWEHAYQLVNTVLDGVNAVGGDLVYLKGSDPFVGEIDLRGPAGSESNPVIVLGVKSATVNEPPIQSDLIPGWRTGLAHTEANRAYNNVDAPTITCTGSGNDISYFESLYFYGVVFEASLDLRWNEVADQSHYFDECSFAMSVGPSHTEASMTLSRSQTGGLQSQTRFNNCALVFNSVDSHISMGGMCGATFIGLTVVASAVPTFLIEVTNASSGTLLFIGSDLSALSGTLINLAEVKGGQDIKFLNCETHASVTLASGTPTGRYRYEMIQSDDTSGKTSGTINSILIVTDAGDIVDELSAVRVSGANDGSTDWALAFTPKDDKTQDQYYGIVGPWMAFKVSGDGTAKTVSVPINNSGAGDYFNNEAWLEVMYPSEVGTAQYDNMTSQMNLLGTPALITDDPSSTWGGGLTQGQILSVSIAPDYVGRAYCRLVFAKNFASTPETLYGDPLPVVS
jgi:hypothetical protein